MRAIQEGESYNIGEEDYMHGVSILQATDLRCAQPPKLVNESIVNLDATDLQKIVPTTTDGQKLAGTNLSVCFFSILLLLNLNGHK